MADNAKRGSGKVTQIIGAVLDIKFTDGLLPEINEAIKIPLGDDRSLTVEVAQHPHGDHRPGSEGQEGEHDAGIEDRAVEAGAEGPGIDEVFRDDGRQMDRPDEDQRGQPQDPDGPEAPQQILAEAPVKAGCS